MSKINIILLLDKTGNISAELKLFFSEIILNQIAKEFLFDTKILKTYNYIGPVQKQALKCSKYSIISNISTPWDI